MSMDIDLRIAACTRYFESGQNATETVDWMMKEFADEDTIRRAKYPRKLCLNVITMGGSGDQKQMNIYAFNAALAKFQANEVMREVAKHRSEMDKYRSETEQLRRRLDDAHDREMQLQNTNRELENQLHNVKMDAANQRILALEAATS